MTKADKFNADKKEIIERLEVMTNAVLAANTPEALAELIAQNLDGERDRSTNLTAKLAGAVMDCVHSINQTRRQK